MGFPRTRMPLACAALAGLLSGCGGSGGDGSTTPVKRQARVEVAEPPAARECGRTSLRTGARPDDLVPRPGRYEYVTEGRRTTKGGGRSRSTRLPRRSELVITRATPVGNLRCFRVQRRLSDSLGDTATFVVRGSDVYVTDLTVTAGGDIVRIRPRPPIRSFAGNELEWSGSFRGATRGRYAASVTGRRELEVGSRRIKAVGIELRISFAGEIEGTERSLRWLALDGNLPVREEVEHDRTFGLDEIGLDYTSRLVGRRGS